MSALPGGVLRAGEDGRLYFWCPGCDGAHAIAVGEGAGPRWTYNGDPARPTFKPSILVRGYAFTERGLAQYQAWRDAGFPKTNEEFERRATVCHSYVTDGRIQFLADCTHGLAGQTVALPPFDADEDPEDA